LVSAERLGPRWLRSGRAPVCGFVFAVDHGAHPRASGSPSLLSGAIALPSEELFYTDLAKLRGWPAARLAARLPLAPARNSKDGDRASPGCVRVPSTEKAASGSP